MSSSVTATTLNQNANPVGNDNVTSSSSPQLVPESILKRRHDLDELKARRAAQAITQPRAGKNRKTLNTPSYANVRVIKPETFLARATSRRNHSIRYKRVTKKGMQARASKTRVVKKKELVLNDHDEEEEEEKEQLEDGENKKQNTTTVTVKYAANSVGSNLVFVVRIRDNWGIPKNVKKVLSHFKLRNVNEGVFVRYNESTRKMLHLVEAWVTYGIPSKSIITDLIKRRGHGRIDGKRIPLSDNTVIEKALGSDTGIICVEDLVHEIHTVGPDFKKANSFLWPFRLCAPRSNFEKDQLNFKSGGDYGDRGEEMNDLIRQML